MMSSEIWQAPAKINLYLEITGRSEDAMDAVQDGFIKAFAGLSGFQRRAGPRRKAPGA